MAATWNLQAALTVIQKRYNDDNTACRAAWTNNTQWPPTDPKDAQIANLTADRDAVRASFASSQAALSDAQSALASANQNLDAANVLLTAMTAERDDLAARLAAATTPIHTPITYTPKAYKTLVDVAGQKWQVQTGTPDGISIGSDGSVVAKAKAGEYVSDFDTIRKVRAELCGQRLYAKGELIRLAGKVKLDADAVATGADWGSLFQIHQADTRRTDGSLVAASPMFAVDVLPNANGDMILRVRGETGTGTQPTFSPSRPLGIPVPFSLGVEHDFVLEVIDGHGTQGKVFFSLDGLEVCNFTGPTGYEYVDLYPNVLVNGKSQNSNSYLKMGIYAGKNSGSVPPTGFSERVAYRDLTT